jgi:hypothetical protein
MITRFKELFTKRYVLVFRGTDGKAFARVRMSRREYQLIETAAMVKGETVEEFFVELITDIARGKSVVGLQKKI